MMPSIWFVVKKQRRSIASFLLLGILLLATITSLDARGSSTSLLPTLSLQKAAGAGDTTAPTVRITTPTGGSIVRAGTAIWVIGWAQDNTGGSGIKLVEVRLNNGAFQVANPGTPGWSSWWAGLSIPAITGSYQITAKVTDIAGNQAYYQIIIFADNIPPSVTISSPKASSTVSAGVLRVTGAASDNAGGGIRLVEVKAGTGSYVTAVPRAIGDWYTWSASVNISTPGTLTLTARATDKAGNVKLYSVTITVSASSLDKFGIKKIYPTLSGGNEWYVNMDNPTSDPLFRNLPSMTKQSDGSWQVSASQVRMEAWSPENKKWLNVEITGYAKMISGSNELIQWYSRGGHHTSSNECLGSAYKARLYGDGQARWVKEVTHPAYAGNRGSVQVTNTPLEDRWIGFKAVIYNFVENGKTYVRMQSYIDDDVTDANGNLVIRNNWKLASVYEDRGGWSTGDTDFNATCFRVNKDSTQQYRQRDEILNLPGGTSTQNIAAWRSDSLTWNWKYLSVREIALPGP
jgi:hypothetical protein